MSTCEKGREKKARKKKASERERREKREKSERRERRVREEREKSERRVREERRGREEREEREKRKRERERERDVVAVFCVEIIFEGKQNLGEQSLCMESFSLVFFSRWEGNVRYLCVTVVIFCRRREVDRRSEHENATH